MAIDPAQLPDDIGLLKAMLIAAEGRATTAEARASSQDAEFADLKLTIAKMRRNRFGASSEHAAKLDQLELQLAELIERVSEDKATDVIAGSPSAAPVDTQKPARRPLPERLVHPAPSSAHAAAARRSANSARIRRRRWSGCRRNGRSSCTCANGRDAEAAA